MKTIIYNNTLAWYKPFEYKLLNPIIQCKNELSEDIYQTPIAYTFNYSVPGFRKKDLKMKVQDDLLTIEGSYKNRRLRWWSKESEIREKHFVKNIRLYRDMDSNKIQAQFKDGILSIHIPKKEEYVSYREIPISGQSTVVEMVDNEKSKVNKLLKKIKHKLSSYVVKYTK
ncbi:Hsp20/alpha crystallin family protein [Saccharicrinis fermentans]|uniref:Hsp20/alpha crystallin family protein n=1 Tax=Saccharicrinis fermentans DSM 9555 = JCM 21142 TaxID=869213 RepID=W7YLY8_9BACT|nr:Hsp20/alpha crystallin family protein [Saccharicrinis fermentans]GAF05666.1 hsp20/alpha crystallin family protein [Saccharicrinis fermentans DSM 9555 = JCM 21142]